MQVPFFDLRGQYRAIRDEVDAAIARVGATQQFILGPEVEAFERELAATVGVRFAIGVSSGTDALLVSLTALGVGPGDEVVVPTFSFFATAGSVARLGARPVFVDVDGDTLMMTAESVRPALTPRTRAIVPVHLFGLCAEMEALAAVASEAGVALVEDAAQAIGATYDGRPAGSFGLLACFSFFPTKNLGAWGDGGLVATSDEALAARIRRLRNHGAEQRYYHHEVGGNFRLDALQAAILRTKLPHLAAWNAQRRANAARYRELFERAGLVGRIRLPGEPAGRMHTYHQYVIRVQGRDALRQHLAERGIGSEVYYPVPLHRQACFQGDAPAPALPVAEAAAAEVLALPIYPELTREQQACVVEAIADWMQ